MTSKTKIKPSTKKEYQPCIYCNSKIENGDSYICNNCGSQLCWDCYDDFHEDKDPYCPECDAELLSDSDSQQSDKTTTLKTKQPGIKSTGDDSSVNGDLSKVRVIKKNLVYIIGLSPEIANEEILMRKEYFGQYGKVSKIVVNTNNAYNPKGSNGPSFSAYVTYSCEREASMAIIGSDEFTINERIIRASYGTTKYCQFFLKQQECPNLPECLYLHAFSKDKELLPKDEITSSKSIFVGQTKMAISNLQKYIPELVKIKNTPINYTPALPSPQSIIQKLIDEDLLDIQTPPETQQIDVKVDKKKKDENKPFIDQWSMDIQLPKKSKKETEEQITQKQEEQGVSLKKSQSQVKQEDPNKISSKEEDSSSTSTPPREGQSSGNEKEGSPKNHSTGHSLIHSNSSPYPNNIITTGGSSTIATNSASQADSSSNKSQTQQNSPSSTSKSSQEVTMFTSAPSKETAQAINAKKGKTNNSSQNPNSTTSNSNASSTNHSRTSSISQKASSNQTTSHQTNSNPKYIPSSQINTYYEKKEQKNCNQEGKFVKHQYIPANQVIKQTQKTEVNQKEQHYKGTDDSQIQMSNSKQVEKYSLNGTRSVGGTACSSPAPQLLKNQQMEQDKYQPGEDITNVIKQEIEPKYVLQKVVKIQRLETPDKKIMKKLISRTHNKNHISCFEFARQNNAECHEELDIIAHIFDGTYIQLTNKLPIKSTKSRK